MDKKLKFAICNAPFLVLSFCTISTNALPILNEEASGNLVEHLELGLTNKNSAPGVSPYDSSTLPRAGACSTGYLGGEARPTLEACVSSCTGSCAFISYCASTKALCTAAHANKCARYSSCPSSDGHSAPGSTHSDYVTYSKSGWCFMQADFAGHDIPGKTIANCTSPEQCQAECLKVASCKYFTWSSSKSGYRKNTCWLKSDKSVHASPDGLDMLSGPKKGCAGWSTSNQGCQTLQSESSCIGSKDGRDASHGIGDSHCDWCCGEACTSGSANKCEPHTWLLKQSSYTGKAKNGAGYNTCPPATAEAEKFVEIARNKPTQQSSDAYMSSASQINSEMKRFCDMARGDSRLRSQCFVGGFAKKAVDGNTNGDFWQGNSCTHTKNEKSWWRVNLGRKYEIEKVTIWNRADCCADRLSGAKIQVKDSKQNGKLTGSCGDAKTGLTKDTTQTAQCTRSSSMEAEVASKYPMGDQVYIEAKHVLTLCEVKVYGRKPFKKKAKSCGKPKVSGAWKFQRSSSLEASFTYTVGVTKTKEQASSNSWSSSVESSMSHGWSVEASVSVGWGAEELIQSGQRFVSGEATVTVGGHGEYSSSKSSTNEATTEVRKALEQSTETSMSWTLPPGAMWQWMYTVKDDCGSAPIKVNHVVVTANKGEPPCCLPGYNRDPTRPHGPCINWGSTSKLSPCLAGCKLSTCNETAATAETASADCEAVLSGLATLSTSGIDVLTKSGLAAVLGKCPTLTGKQLAGRLNLPATAELAIQLDALREE